MPGRAAAMLIALGSLAHPAIGAAAGAAAAPPPGEQALGGRFEGRVVTAARCLAGPQRPGRAAGAGAGVVDLLAPFVPGLVGAGIDGLAAALEKAAADEKTSLQATGGEYFYRATASGGGAPATVAMAGQCLALIVLAPGAPRSALAAALAAGGVELPAGRLEEYLAAAGLDLGGVDPGGLGPGGLGPAALVELRAQASHEGEAFRLEPNLIWIGRSLGSSRPGDVRDFAFSFGLRTVEGKAFAAGSYVFPRLAIGRLLGPDLLAVRQAGWLPAPDLSATSRAVLSRLAGKAGGASQEIEPYNLTLSVTETRQGRRWLQTVASVLRGGRKEAAQTAAEALLPAPRAAAVLAAGRDENDLRTRLAKARGDRRIACLKRAAATGPVEQATLERDIVLAQLAANQAARELGEPPPYPDSAATGCTGD